MPQSLSHDDAGEPQFSLAFDPAYGQAITLALGVLRVTANNPSPLTFLGTNSYVVGDERRCLVIDPGPADIAHRDALLRAVAGRTVEAVLLTHSHADHAALAPAFSAAVSAPLLGAPRVSALGEKRLGGATLDASSADGLVFAHDLRDGEQLSLAGAEMTVIATPGHASDHLAFALEGTGIVFSGDHVMAWSTPVVAPPDGVMQDYMASLRKLLQRSDSRYLPGHGGVVERPVPFVRALIRHRVMREGAIVERLEAGDRTIPAIVAAIYPDLDPRLVPAAGLSVLAHLIDLQSQGRVRTHSNGMGDTLYLLVVV
ncbi:MBL fold metallo-hydrolase [Jiella sp. MQZ9-1]|uniref:MBL fold metallo-hydrolase n=1 Tax=Jiella flava TaxID=2816857 RepID=A0A939FY32_9HYPH|nr:MBL fold metallo-hydrolase [Jiella flava]MBO0662321.1 MBL fold metallo-hydrolase [Jiella flava]MCD2470850.1 MBL fold metallo-hydrolase [Jiella flava]